MLKNANYGFIQPVISSIIFKLLNKANSSQKTQHLFEINEPNTLPNTLLCYSQNFQKKIYRFCQFEISLPQASRTELMLMQEKYFKALKGMLIAALKHITLS